MASTGRRAGYSGAVYSEYEAGFSSAEGYTGVVRGTIASGYTGAAPVPSAPVSTKGRSDIVPVMVTASPYDEAVAEPGTAPGAAVPLDYRAPAPALDLDAVKEADEEALSRARDEGADAPAFAEVLAVPGEDAPEAIDVMVREVSSLVPEVRLSPNPEPNESLARAIQLLREPSGPGWPFRRPSDLLGPAAEALDSQLAEVLAESKPNNLGVALIQGIIQEGLSTAIRAGPSAIDRGVNPIGAAFDSMSQLVQAIRDEMGRGESFWGAANAVLNPATRALSAGWEANSIAGEALAAAQRGEWRRAVQLSRESGRAMGRAVVAAEELYWTAEGLRGLGTSVSRGLRTLRASRARGRIGPTSLPPPPQSPEPSPVPVSQAGQGVPMPIEQPVAPQPSPPAAGLTGAIVQDVATGPQLPVVELTRPNPGHPDLRIFDRAYVETARPLLEEDLRFRQAQAAAELRAMPPERRLNPRSRFGTAKRVYNALERVTAADLQLANPERSYLTNGRWVSVVTEGGEIPVSEIPAVRAIDPDHPGTISDTIGAHPDTTWRDLEQKTPLAVEKAYPARGVEVGAFKRGTHLSRQIRKRQAIVDYANETNGRIRVVADELDGRSVDTLLDPAGFRGTTALPYRQVPH
jgi:hypothetical protein